jgi:DNA polymerase I-like protein with 3'-5' exonuclease and polymerase domains
MKEEMESVVDRYDWINVPLIAECEFGKNWWCMEKLDLTVNE